MAEDNKRGSLVAQVGTATVEMRSVGFALYAEEFLLAAAAIPNDSRARGNTAFTPVPHYLLCRALELILKAYLLTKGWKENELKKRQFGHDLEARWTAALDKGLLNVLNSVDPEFASDLAAAKSYYHGKAFEYFDFRRWADGYQGLPELVRYRSEVERIVTVTKSHVVSVS
jgi:hypothetical protein